MLSMDNFNIIKTSMENWQKAQEWEKNHWVRQRKIGSKYGKDLIWKILSVIGLMPKYRGDDANYWWASQFDNYNFLPDEINNAIELGCGPYTNIRLIIEKCTPRHLFLSDPLIKTYINFKQSFVGKIHRQGLCILDDHPIEECPFAPNYFDLVVLINVLDHVQDAHICINNAINITKPGGILLVGQELSNKDDIEKYNKKYGAYGGDIGHPIRIGHDWLDAFLNNGFENIIKKILSREIGRDPEIHYGTYIFAGEKLRF
jgi:SAM-dependent methyltransferase